MAAFWVGQVDQVQLEQAIEDATDEMAKDFEILLEQKLKAMHLRTLPPGPRLAEYDARSDEVWSQLRNIFPKDYAEETADWHLLKMKVMRGEMAPPAPPPPAPPSPYAPAAPPWGIADVAEALRPGTSVTEATRRRLVALRASSYRWH